MPPRLPRGRHNLPADFVSANQQRRLHLATGAVVAELGYGGFTVSHVIEAAGVSRTTFYKYFDDKRDCVLAAHRDAFGRLLTTIVEACATATEWPAKVAAALAAVVAFAAEEPGSIALLNLGSAADREVSRQVADSAAQLAALLRDGRRHMSPGPELPDLVEEATIGALAGVLARHCGELTGRRRERLRGELVQLALAPYVGLEAAARLGR